MGALVLLLLFHASILSAALTPVNLRCEYSVDPMGMDIPHPRLYWKVVSEESGQHQTAWQVLAASSTEALERDEADVWDSGRIESDATQHIRYEGRALESSETIHWKVRVWDQLGEPSVWSATARWTMGVLGDADWSGAKWIGETVTNAATTLLRREFNVKAGLRRALAHVCGLGQYELSANGTKVGDDVVSPGWTTYTQTCLYDTRDVTSFLREGVNALGLELANGMYMFIISAGDKVLVQRKIAVMNRN